MKYLRDFVVLILFLSSFFIASVANNRVYAAWVFDATAPVTTYLTAPNGAGCTTEISSPHNILTCPSSTTSVSYQLFCADPNLTSGCNYIYYTNLNASLPPAPIPSQPAKGAMTSLVNSSSADPKINFPSGVIIVNMSSDPRQILYSGSEDVAGNYATGPATLVVVRQNVQGQVTFDTVNNGTPPVPNVPITLTASGWTNAESPYTATTDASGNYSSWMKANGTPTPGGVIPGPYIIQAGDPTGYAYRRPAPISLSVTSSTTQNFLFEGYSLKGRVYIDKNKNEDYEAGESLDIAAPGVALNPSLFQINAPGTVPGIGTPQVTPQGEFTITGFVGFTNLASFYTLKYAPTPAGYKITGPPQLSWTFGVHDFTGATVLGTNWNYNPRIKNNGVTLINYVCYTGSGGLPPCASPAYQILELRMGITESLQWFQGIGGDIRSDSGFSNSVPEDAIRYPAGAPYAYTSLQAPLPGSPQGSFNGQPGVIFAGTSNPEFSLSNYTNPPKICTTPCIEQSSSKRWIVGGANYSDTYNLPNDNFLRSSYDKVNDTLRRNGITPASIPNGACPGGNTTDCRLKNLPKGVYSVTGDFVINDPPGVGDRQFQGNGAIIILVSGNLRINTTIRANYAGDGTSETQIPVFIVKGDITVNPTVGGTSSTTCDYTSPTHTGCHLEGVFSTDKSFNLPSIQTDILGRPGTSICANAAPDPQTDKRLNVAGTIIVNANTKAGGGSLNFKDGRDMCDENLLYPTLQITHRLDFILNAPDIIKADNFLWQEVAP